MDVKNIVFFNLIHLLYNGGNIMKVKSYYEEQINGNGWEDYEVYMAEHYEAIDQYIDEMAEEYEQEILDQKTDKILAEVFGM